MNILNDVYLLYLILCMSIWGGFLIILLNSSYSCLLFDLLFTKKNVMSLTIIKDVYILIFFNISIGLYFM